ncbi:MAG: winged helix-turn-helix domain-containing protein [Acidobacteria bacterium]|nr:winged helix-turn-helix domain-containing protein [Acidobacteriota bacterium]
MTHQPALIYEFGDFSVDAARRQLRGRGGVAVPLATKAFETLLYLVARSGTVLDKDELLGAIWPNAIVEENNLTQAISALRRALGESRAEHRYIMTVSGRGYCFVADVRTRQPHSETLAAPTLRTMAVLPFQPLVAEYRDPALELGMADTLIARLSGREIIVRPVNSVRKYVELDQDPLVVGRELDVELVLEGSIQRRGDSLRITVRLDKTADGTSLWAGTFDEQLTDIFVVQDAIANKVAAALELQLGVEEQKHLTKRHTENVEAYQSYLKGRFHWNKRGPQDLQKAIEHFKQAIALDPSYALAHAGLADAYTLLANAGSPAQEIMPKALEAAQKAVSLDEDLAEAHAALGNIFIYYLYDFVGAEREEKRAIELNPYYATAHHWYSELLMGLGRHQEALAEIRRALEIEPLSLILNRQYGASLLFARQYDAAIEQMKKTVELDANFAVGHSTLSVAYRMKGNYAESVEELARFQELVGRAETAALMRESFAEGVWQGFLRAMTDERRPANLTPYNVATFHAALGEKDKAFAELNKAYQNREGILGLLKVDPRFDSLHDDPRFEDLARRFKIAPSDARRIGLPSRIHTNDGTNA